MGCAQSTVKDQVQDTTPNAADTAVAAAPASSDLVIHATEEPAADVAAAPPTSAATATATETKTETAAAEPEPETAAAADAAAVDVAEEVVAAPVEEAAVAAPAEPVAEEAAAAAPAKEVVEAAVEQVVEAAVEEVAAAAVEEVVEEVKETPAVAAEPAEETTSAAPAAVAEEAAEAALDKPAAVAEADAAVVEAEPEVEAAPAVDETKESGLVFVSAGVSFGDKGVAFYSFTASNSEDPAQDVKISKRFNDFKTLHAEIATIMANESNVADEHQDKFKIYPALPALPKTSLFRSRSNTKQTEEREAQFLKILNAIARHPIAAESPKFKAFLA